MQRPNRKEHLKRVLTLERSRRALSQEEVAEAIGVSTRNYQRWEQGLTYPQPHYLRLLREYFGPCIDENVATNESRDGLNGHTIPGSSKEIKAIPGKSRHLKLIISFSILIFAVGIGYVLYLTHPYGFGPVRPGGVWISPVGPTVGNIVYFAAYAYPNHSADPAIDYVDFTAYWPGVDPRAWKIVCQVRIPVRQDVYACDANLQQLGAPPGQITISFDVHDLQGNVHFAPNGEHKVVYSPGS